VSFEPGFIPQGWLRGQRLRVYAATTHEQGYVSLDVSDAPTESNSNDVTLLRFRYAETEKVRQWLDWWQQSPE